jgi:hypothetical protein
MNPKFSDQSVDEARARLLEVVHVIVTALPKCDLPARQMVDVRRDLVFLVAESRRNVFRPVIADAVCTAVLTEVSQGLPARTRKAVLALGGAA